MEEVGFFFAQIAESSSDANVNRHQGPSIFPQCLHIIIILIVFQKPPQVRIDGQNYHI